ncbi:MAG: ComF family protein [Halochromatium sp.]|nr:ComF family protein [Halochromatium sp.]
MIVQRSIALLYPPTCVLCGAPGEDDRDLCAGCRDDLPSLGACCPRCAQPFAPSRDTKMTLTASSLVDAAPQPLCSNCQRQTPPFERCLAAYRYEDPLPGLVAGIKFKSKLNLIRLLGELLADVVQTDAERRDKPLPQALVPVPLHLRRLRARGYNQALEIARILSRRTGVPLLPQCCRRTRATQAQSELDERHRHLNIRGAFEAIAPMPRHIALIDDVMTTGATVSELTRVMTAAGCQRVEIWALARTP